MAYRKATKVFTLVYKQSEKRYNIYVGNYTRIKPSDTT